MVEIFEISDGICPVKALLSNKLPHQKRKRVEDPSNIKRGLFSVTKETLIISLDCKRGIPSYRWTRFFSLPSSGGIDPFNELLFIWL